MAGRAGVRAVHGFLGAETNQWYPDLVYDNHPVEPPRSPEQGYHLTEDLTDKALEFIRDAKAVAPDKPFFLYYCPGACHVPHHAPKEWIDKYRGKFDMGYEAYRELVFERQKRTGVVTDQAELSAINLYSGDTSAQGKGWPELDTVRPWDSLTDGEKRLFCRMAEVYAGFLAHADHEIGRLLDYLEESGQLDNTIIVLVSDNGASGEGGPNGSVNENKIFNGIPDTIEANLPHLEDLGSPKTYNHYPTGWACAFNTPFKLWKRYSNWEGGTADPMIVSWPARITGTGIRRQYVHAIDMCRPCTRCSASTRPRWSRATSSSRWRGSASTPPSTTRTPPPTSRLSSTRWAAPGRIRNHSYTVAVEVTLDTQDAAGVLFAHGSRFGGHALYLKDGKLKYVYNFVGDGEQIVESTEPLPTGHAVLSASFAREGDSMPAEGTLTLHLGDREAGRGRIKTQPGKFSIAGEGLNVGQDAGEPITDDYPGPAPWAFTGGTIHRAVVDVSGEPFVDLAAEARMAFMRD